MRFPEDHDRFSALSEGVKNIMLALAVLVGGVWTLYTFWSLHKTKLAELEFAQKKVRPIVQVTMNASIYEATVDDLNNEHIPPKPGLFIKVKVDIANTGSRPTIINLLDSLEVSRVASGSGRDAVQRGTRLFNVLGAEGAVNTVLLAPGNKNEYQYLVEVKNSGIHTIEFHVPLDPKSFAGNEDMLLPQCTGYKAPADASSCPPPTVRAVTLIHIPPELWLKYLKYQQ